MSSSLYDDIFTENMKLQMLLQIDIAKDVY